MTVLRCIRVRRRRTLLADVRGDHVRAGWWLTYSNRLAAYDIRTLHCAPYNSNIGLVGTTLRSSISSRRCTDLEQSSAAYHICSVTSSLLLSLEDMLLPTMLPLIVVPLEVTLWSMDTLIALTYLLTYYICGQSWSAIFRSHGAPRIVPWNVDPRRQGRPSAMRISSAFVPAANDCVY